MTFIYTFIEDGFYVDSLLKVASSKKAKRLVMLRLELGWVGVPFYRTNWLDRGKSTDNISRTYVCYVPNAKNRGKTTNYVVYP